LGQINEALYTCRDMTVCQGQLFTGRWIEHKCVRGSHWSDGEL